MSTYDYGRHDADHFIIVGRPPNDMFLDAVLCEKGEILDVAPTQPHTDYPIDILWKNIRWTSPLIVNYLR